MTVEEAGQIILENKPWVDCVDCGGLGWLPANKFQYGQHVTTKPDGPTIPVEDCRQCQGKGEFPRDEYIEACELLGIEPPRWTKAEAAKRNYFEKRGLNPEIHDKSIDAISIGQVDQIYEDSFTVDVSVGSPCKVSFPRPK